MSMFKWISTACLLLGLTVVTIGCDKPAEPPVETPDEPEVTMPAEGDDMPAEETPMAEETPEEEAPAGE